MTTTAPSSSSSSAPPPLRTLAEFLESTPPEVSEFISDACALSQYGARILAEPELQLYCPSDTCQGIRFFHCISSSIHLPDEDWKYGFATYICRNCQKTKKMYALAVRARERRESSVVTVYKFGEFPSFGPPTPARVISLIGPDRDVYLRGRRAENQGLGVGAFAYYRRVVENQKGRIIREMGRVAAKLGASSDVLKEFETAASETQFSKAIDQIKYAIPQSLLINGNNPLSLLHSALSDGLHEQDDAVCLELAHSIRIVLTELAERMSQALSDHAELNNAVTRLLNRKKKDGSSSDKSVVNKGEARTKE